MAGVRTTRSPNGAYHTEVTTDTCRSELVVPAGVNPSQNAVLTIHINYELNFLDGRNPVPANRSTRMSFRDRKTHILDSDGAAFPLKDWNLVAEANFERRFRRGQEFWDRKFTLVTPRDYDGFDYECRAGAGWLCRPNVICAFDLRPGRPAHLTLDVVRPEFGLLDSYFALFGDDAFRDNAALYEEKSVTSKTLWHELGHALGQLHILALKGDARCMVDINADRCYEGDNIMGSGNRLEPVNALLWRKLIALHTGAAEGRWAVMMSPAVPARRVPLAAAPVGRPRQF